VLTDIKPHTSVWSAAAKRSENLHYVRQSVDATNAPASKELLKNIPRAKGKKIMRLFSLAFHHFDDELAGKVLRNTHDTADGFWFVPPPLSLSRALPSFPSNSPTLS
jgi:hypothetical protein